MEIVSAKISKQSTTAGISQDMLDRAFNATSLDERKEVCNGVNIVTVEPHPSMQATHNLVVLAKTEAGAEKLYGNGELQKIIQPSLLMLYLLHRLCEAHDSFAAEQRRGHLCGCAELLCCFGNKLVLSGTTPTPSPHSRLCGCG